MDRFQGGELKIGCGVVDDNFHGEMVLMRPLRTADECSMSVIGEGKDN